MFGLETKQAIYFCSRCDIERHHSYILSLNLLFYFSHFNGANCLDKQEMTDWDKWQRHADWRQRHLMTSPTTLNKESEACGVANWMYFICYRVSCVHCRSVTASVQHRSTHTHSTYIFRIAFIFSSSHYLHFSLTLCSALPLVFAMSVFLFVS